MKRSVFHGTAEKDQPVLVGLRQNVSLSCWEVYMYVSGGLFDGSCVHCFKRTCWGGTAAATEQMVLGEWLPLRGSKSLI